MAEAFKVVVILTDGRPIECPEMDLLPGETVYEVALTLYEAKAGGPFLHVDGGDTFQRLIPTDKIAYIDVLAVEAQEKFATGHPSEVEAKTARLSLVRK